MYSNDDLVKLAARYNLAIQRASLRTTSSGLDYVVAFAVDTQNRRWVMRIPRRTDVVIKAQREQKILSLIADHLPVQVPHWQVVSDELIAYRQLEGIPAATTDMEAKAYVWQIDEKNVPDAYSRTLAQALVALHQINIPQPETTGLTVVKPDELRTHMLQRMNNVKSAFGVSDELWKRWQKWLANESKWPRHTCLVHGDLHPGHTLIDHEARVTGIIDWTEATVTDPAGDFVAYHIVFGDNALRKFIDHYAQTGGRTWSGMFEHIVELTSAAAIPLAEFALSSNLPEYQAMARQQLGVSQAHAIVRHHDPDPNINPWVHGKPPQEKIEVVPYDPAWPELFEKLAQKIKIALDSTALEIEHVGSTAVAGLAAKPVIDIDLTVNDPANEDDYVPRLTKIGYDLTIREPTWHEHRCLRLESPRVNLHVFGPHCPETIRHKLFRDWLRQHPEDRKQYEHAKHAAVPGSRTVEEYNRKKQDVIREIYARTFQAAGLLDHSK